MTAKPERHFQGFSRKTFTFLRDLGRHNDKTWFEAHRAVYEEHVLQPLRDLVSDMADFMLGIGQDKPEPIRTWYGYKSFYLTCNRKIDDAILSPRFADQLMKHFGLAAPLYHYIHRTASQVLDARH